MCNFQKILVAFILQFSISGCTAPMDIEVRAGEERLVIYSTLSNSIDATDPDHVEYNAPDSQRVTVQRTLPFFSDRKDNWVSDAVVSISTSQGARYDAFWDEPRKFYITHEVFATEPDVTYTLDVLYDFNGDGTPEAYSATTTAYSTRLEMSSIAVFPASLMGRTMYALLLFGRDPVGPDRYMFRVAVNDTLRSDRLRHWMPGDDILFDGGALNGFPFATFGSEPNDDTTNIWFRPGDKITLLYSTVDEDFAEFVEETQNSGDTSNPMFGGPPYNMRTNITGGTGTTKPLGYFGSLYSSAITATVPGTFTAATVPDEDKTAE